MVVMTAGTALIIFLFAGRTVILIYFYTLDDGATAGWLGRRVWRRWLLAVRDARVVLVGMKADGGDGGVPKVETARIFMVGIMAGTVKSRELQHTSAMLSGACS
jgi:hypothetical protein